MTAAERICGMLRGEMSSWHGIPLDEQDTFFADAEREGMHLLLAWHLRQTVENQAVGPPRLHAALESALRSEIAIELQRRHALQALLAALAAQGIDDLVFKGAAVAALYPDPAVRPRLDSDILVRSRDVLRAAAVLEDHGFAAPICITRELVAGSPASADIEAFKASSQIAFMREDAFGLHHEIDLHWQAAIPQAFTVAFSPEELFAEAISLPMLGPGAKGFGLAHALAIACVHRVAHHHGDARLMWLYDIHLLTERLSPADASRFVEIAVNGRIAAVCAAGLSAARARFAPLPDAPNSLYAALAQAAQADLSAPSSVFLGATLRKVDVLRSDWSSLGRWSDRFRLLRDHLFPPASYVMQRYGISSRTLLPLLYAWRTCSGALGWFRAGKI
jgi:hypothetical protein